MTVSGRAATATYSTLLTPYMIDCEIRMILRAICPELSIPASVRTEAAAVRFVFDQLCGDGMYLEFQLLAHGVRQGPVPIEHLAFSLDDFSERYCTAIANAWSAQRRAHQEGIR